MNKKINLQIVEHNIPIDTYMDYLKFIKYFELNDCILVEQPKKADYILFLTWSAHESAEEDEFEKIEKLKRYREKLIIYGNLPETNSERFHKVFKGKYITTTKIDDIDNLFADFKIKLKEIDDVNTVTDLSYTPLTLSKKSTLEHTPSFRKFCGKLLHDIKRSLLGKRKPVTMPFFIRINWGCPHNCSYCAIKRPMGKLRSKPFENCMQEFKRGLERGYNNFKIVSNEAGAYGLDIGLTLPHLLNGFLKQCDGKDVSVYIDHINPVWVIRYFNELLPIIKTKYINSLWVSIESGNDRILKLMNRGYTSGAIAEALIKFKKAKPKLYLTTEIIIGFPSETEEEFGDSLEAIKNIRPDWVLCYTFQEKVDIPASKLEPKIPEKIKMSRVKRLVDFCNKENIECGYRGK